MRVPLISTAQVHILAEGVVEPLPFAVDPPQDLAPATPFDLRVHPARPPRTGWLRARRPPLHTGMTKFRLETLIEAPIDVVFDLARDIGLPRAIDGRDR